MLADAELARADAIVVARSDETSKFEDHGIVEGNVRKSFAWLTRLVVERSVKGTIQAGDLPITIDWGLSWDGAGRPSSGSSTEMPGDVEDVREPGLWFLAALPAGGAAAWGPMGFHRSIQPLALEAWFAALASADPAAGIRAALASASTVVALRALEHVAGGRWPWPYGGGSFDDWLHGGERAASSSLHPFRDAVAAALRAEDPVVRGHAAVVLDDLDGERAPAAVRALLRDPDGNVRAIAVGLLAGRRDAASFDAFAGALGGAVSPGLRSEALARLAATEDARVVPALIASLEDDGGPDLDGPAPAVAARGALSTLTGYAFPFSVRESTVAWEEARALTDPGARRARLRERLGDGAVPLVARFVPADPARPGAWIAVTNRGDRAVDVAARPSLVRCRAATSWSTYALPQPSPPEFVRLAPGESVTVRIDHESDGATVGFAPPAGPERTVTVTLRGLRKAPGVRGWMGELVVAEP